MANSSMLVLPTITAPASNSLWTTVPSYGATKPPSIFEPQVVRTPLVDEDVFEGDRHAEQIAVVAGGAARQRRPPARAHPSASP